MSGIIVSATSFSTGVVITPSVVNVIVIISIIIGIVASVQLLINFVITSFMFEKFPDSIISFTLSFVTFLVSAFPADCVEYFAADWEEMS